MDQLLYFLLGFCVGVLVVILIEVSLIFRSMKDPEFPDKETWKEL